MIGAVGLGAPGVQCCRIPPERAGRSTVVLDESDLDAAATRLLAAGIDDSGPESGGGARILQLTDPDGNHVVLAGV